MVTVIYVLVNISYLTVMSPSEMLVSDAVAVTFGNRILGPMAWLMPLSVAFSTFGAANGTIFAAGRLCYVASREGHLVDVLSYIHVKKMTPAPAVLFHAIVALGMVLYGSIEGLIDFFRYGIKILGICDNNTRMGDQSVSKTTLGQDPLTISPPELRKVATKSYPFCKRSLRYCIFKECY